MSVLNSSKKKRPKIGFQEILKNTSTLGEWYIFGCACSKHKWVVGGGGNHGGRGGVICGGGNDSACVEAFVVVVILADVRGIFVRVLYLNVYSCWGCGVGGGKRKGYKIWERF